MRPLATCIAALALTAGLPGFGAHAQQPSAKQMQAIRQACASGALSAEECTQRGIANSDKATPTPSPSSTGGFPSAGGDAQGQIFEDPGGRYRLKVPAGWNVAVDNGNAAFSFDQAKIQTICGSQQSTQAEAQIIAKQYGAGFQNLKIFNQGAFKAGAHDAYGINFDGTLKGVHYSMLVMSIAAGGNHFLTLVSYMPSAQAAAMNDTVIGMANSVQF